MRVISQELQPLLTVIAAVLDRSGNLLEANAGFMRLLGTGDRHIGANAAACFNVPGFTELAASQALAGGEVYRGTMRLRDAGGGDIPLRGRVWCSAHGLCVLAEADVGVPGIEPRASEAQYHARTEGELETVDPALFDALTGTGNRERLEQSLATQMTRVKRGGLPLCVLMVGLDRFAEVSARHGPAGGDKVLARVGFLLRLLTRPTDIATRSGTQEFAVLLPHTNIAQAASTAERIRKVLETDIVEPLGEPAAASFGLAEYRTGEDGASFLSRAVHVVGRARDAGGNRVVVDVPDTQVAGL